jgi:hypothetical protein
VDFGMSVFKEDMKQAKERLAAWWDHDLIDRPCISYWMLREGARISVDEIREYFDPWYLAQNWDDITTCLINFESNLNKLCYGGESIPRFFPNYGPGIMAAVFGVTPEYKGGTMWFHRDTSLKEIIPLLESAQMNMNNPWYARLRRVTEFAAKRAKKDYCVAMTDLGGVLDILASFLGPEKLIITMNRQPELIDRCRTIILEKLLKVYDDLQTVIERYGEGCSSWMHLWCPKRWYPIQSDFSYMLSPKWFKRFALPDIIAQAEHLDYALYHLDGPNQLVHLDDLLAVSAIHGIQWVPGASEAPKCSDKWMPVYKKIQAAGKNIFIDFFEDLKGLSHFYTQLEPKGLLINIIALEDNIGLKYYLPKFVGGQGGEGDFKEFRRSMRKRSRPP